MAMKCMVWPAMKYDNFDGCHAAYEKLVADFAEYPYGTFKIEYPLVMADFDSGMYGDWRIDPNKGGNIFHFDDEKFYYKPAGGNKMYRLSAMPLSLVDYEEIPYEEAHKVMLKYCHNGNAVRWWTDRKAMTEEQREMLWGFFADGSDMKIVFEKPIKVRIAYEEFGTHLFRDVSEIGRMKGEAYAISASEGRLILPRRFTNDCEKD